MIHLILAVAAIGTCLAQCPDTFERHGDVCYKVVAIKANWIDSREYCKLFGGELLRIETADEQVIIDGILNRVHGSISDELYWINGGDMLSENEFRWFFESHSEVIPHNGFTNFSQGQPDNAGSVEHCLEIIFNGHNALWNDRNCDAVRNFICEAKLAGQTEIVG